MRSRRPVSVPIRKIRERLVYPIVELLVFCLKFHAYYFFNNRNIRHAQNITASEYPLKDDPCVQIRISPAPWEDLIALVTVIKKMWTKFKLQSYVKETVSDSKNGSAWTIQTPEICYLLIMLPVAHWYLTWR